MVVLRKPGKAQLQLQTAGGWRSTALLSAVGKVMEAIVAGGIAEAAETNNLLPRSRWATGRANPQNSQFDS